MIDSISGGRLIAGFAVGGGPEAYNYNIPSPQSRQRFLEAVDLIVRTWTEDGPFEHEGPSYPLRYVNIWPKPRQTPHPKIWIPGALSAETMDNVRSRVRLFPVVAHPRGATRQARERFADIVQAPRRHLPPVPHGRLAVGLCRRDRRAGQDRVGGGDLVFPQILPQGPSQADRPDAHLRPRRAVAIGALVAGLSGELDRWRARCWAMRITGKSSNPRPRSSSAARRRCARSFGT